jgi:hypothetical protein
VRIFHAKMPIGIENLNLKLLAFPLGRAKIIEAVNR